MDGEHREPSDAKVVRWRRGRDDTQGQDLATGVGAGGDARVDGGAEELLETVGGFEVERGVSLCRGLQKSSHEGRITWSWTTAPP